MLVTHLPIYMVVRYTFGNNILAGERFLCGRSTGLSGADVVKRPVSRKGNPDLPVVARGSIRRRETVWLRVVRRLRPAPRLVMKSCELFSSKWLFSFGRGERKKETFSSFTGVLRLRSIIDEMPVRVAETSAPSQVSGIDEIRDRTDFHGACISSDGVLLSLAPPIISSFSIISSNRNSAIILVSLSSGWEILIAEAKGEKHGCVEPNGGREGANPECAIPSACSLLSVGQAFAGTQNVSSVQKDEAWRVNVRIQGCDLEHGYLCGTMEALNVPLADTPVVTFWEGEIVDIKNYTFFTGKWEATPEDDVKHWSKFTSFSPLLSQVEADGGKSLDLSNYPYIFMRWKEQYFVNVGIDCGLTIAGFYYVCFSCSDGSINGFYYDPNSRSIPVFENCNCSFWLRQHFMLLLMDSEAIGRDVSFTGISFCILIHFCGFPFVRIGPLYVVSCHYSEYQWAKCACLTFLASVGEVCLLDFSSISGRSVPALPV
ncbi:hypothetical protein ACLOJK_030050 [Asimina triloba]